MKKLLITLGCVVTFFACTAAPAGAIENDIVKVGLRFGSSAVLSANLQNEVGEGYEFGWFDEDREFVDIAWTEEEKISMTAAGTVYVTDAGEYSTEDGDDEIGPWRVQVDDWYDDYDEALEIAEELDGWVAWIDGEYVVRLGAYTSEKKAERAIDDLDSDYDYIAEEVGDSAVMVTVTRSTEIIFEFDGDGDTHLGIMPDGGRKRLTWFKGYKYKGGFEYVRPADDMLLRVINVVDLEDYVKGVVPYEMSGDWPMAAMEAQAVCARTVACHTTKHFALYGFDVCNTTDCQVYNGANKATDESDEAVENTEGECMYYDGELISAVYHSSNGGATEDAENVWGAVREYLIGKEDPYEELIDIPNYEWETTYTSEELTWLLQEKDYNIGRIVDVYVSGVTEMGNVAEVTFRDSKGKELVVTGNTASSIFYSSTLNKSARSQRFTITGGTESVTAPSTGGGSGSKKNGFYVNGSDDKLSSLDGVSVINGDGDTTEMESGDFYVITADGKEKLTSGAASSGKKKPSSNKTGDEFTLTGTGYGHNVGMSQYGARAMAEEGYDYEEILEFYFTDIKIK